MKVLAKVSVFGLLLITRNPGIETGILGNAIFNAIPLEKTVKKRSLYQ